MYTTMSEFAGYSEIAKQFKTLSLCAFTKVYKTVLYVFMALLLG